MCKITHTHTQFFHPIIQLNFSENVPKGNKMHFVHVIMPVVHNDMFTLVVKYSSALFLSPLKRLIGEGEDNFANKDGN